MMDDPHALTLELASPLTTLSQRVQGQSGLAIGHSSRGGQMRGFEGDMGHICWLKLAGVENVSFTGQWLIEKKLVTCFITVEKQ